MTVVLGAWQPETDAVWDPLVEALGRADVIRVSPPGFGAPLMALSRQTVRVRGIEAQWVYPTSHQAHSAGVPIRTDPAS